MPKKKQPASKTPTTYSKLEKITAMEYKFDFTLEELGPYLTQQLGLDGDIPSSQKILAVAVTRTGNNMHLSVTVEQSAVPEAG